ncbi:MAG: class I SAM-dependent methyltransferase [Calditrichales bacterium]|nr:MAG: class I SAM-dependent methyltransferase [Calditrichales bacterium]
MIKLGPCRLIPSNLNNGDDGRLVFLKDVYDFQSLFYEKKIVKVQSNFINLPLIIAHKEKIKKGFREFTANLTYDINVYKTLFDQFDTEIKDEPVEIREAVQQAIIDTEGRKFMAYLDEKLEELENLVQNFSNDEHERHGFYFRKQLWNIILSSAFMKRTNIKPRGYAGDSEMMQMVYRNCYEGDTIFAKLMHKHPMEHPASQAVRSRRKLISSRLIDLKENHKINPDNPLRVLSVACGPGFEITDILQSPADIDRYHFTLLDQDPSALSEAQGIISQLEARFGKKIQAGYLNDSVRTMIAKRQIQENWGFFDYIYSMGLFDYLTPPAARAVIEKLYQLLSPGGEMIIGNFHIKNPSRCYMEYWCDWVLYYRDEEEFLELTSKLENCQARVFFENTGSQMFLHVRKEMPNN